MSEPDNYQEVFFSHLADLAQTRANQKAAARSAAEVRAAAQEEQEQRELARQQAERIAIEERFKFLQEIGAIVGPAAAAAGVSSDLLSSHPRRFGHRGREQSRWGWSLAEDSYQDGMVANSNWGAVKDHGAPTEVPSIITNEFLLGTTGELLIRGAPRYDVKPLAVDAIRRSSEVFAIEAGLQRFMVEHGLDVNLQPPES